MLSTSQNVPMVSPPAGWGHHPLIAKKSECGQVCQGRARRHVHFTLDKSERTNYSPCADDVYTKTNLHIPNAQYMQTEKKPIP